MLGNLCALYLCVLICLKGRASEVQGLIARW